MDVKQLVAELRTTIEKARTKPMSSSVAVNRQEMLTLIGRLEAALSDALVDQERMVREHDDLLVKAREEADTILSDARAESERLVSEAAVRRTAETEAAAERDAARHDAQELRRETDDYVDGRLATFEVTLTKILDAVTRGRAQLAGRSHFHELAERSDGSDATADGEGAAPPE